MAVLSQERRRLCRACNHVSGGKRAHNSSVVVAGKVTALMSTAVLWDSPPQFHGPCILDPNGVGCSISAFPLRVMHGLFAARICIFDDASGQQRCSTKIAPGRMLGSMEERLHMPPDLQGQATITSPPQSISTVVNTLQLTNSQAGDLASSTPMRSSKTVVCVRCTMGTQDAQKTSLSVVTPWLPCYHDLELELSGVIRSHVVGRRSSGLVSTAQVLASGPWLPGGCVPCQWRIFLAVDIALRATFAVWSRRATR